jgi:7-carboxy-7-deazaguanine synthase
LWGHMTDTLIITEIYASIQGESSYAGLPCTFVRLTGCPLRCRWCDTAYGFEGGQKMSLDEVTAKVRCFGPKLVELTGGEPLAQEACAPLARALIEQGYKVLIETGGSEDVSVLHPAVHIIMDIKCPGSRMHDRNRWENLDHLKPSDEIKMVIADRLDFDWAIEKITDFSLASRFKVLLSPAFGLLKPKDLAEWIMAHRLDVRLNLQQHKYIWHPTAKGV